MAGVRLAGVLFICTSWAKAARWALTEEHASLQGLAEGPAMAGVR